MGFSLHRTRVSKFSLSLFAVLFLFAAQVLAQSVTTTTVKGRVTDRKTGRPLEFVNVFLSGTTIGAETDEKGMYEIKNVPEGRYKLIFSMVGYKVLVYDLVIRPGTIRTKNGRLAPQAIEGEGLVVSAKKGKGNRKWKKDFRKFRRQFIGESVNGRETKILNREVLSFRKDERTGHFIATASEPLLVENKRLGYKILVVLDSFRWSFEDKSGRYVIHPKFEEMKVKSMRQMIKWESNRAQTYQGSMRHFLQSVVNDDWSSQGFSTDKIIKRDQSQSNGKGYAISLAARNSFNVFYRGSRSNLQIESPKGFEVDSYGNLKDPNMIIVSGQWMANRLGDMLPFEYRK